MIGLDSLHTAVHHAYFTQSLDAIHHSFDVLVALRLLVAEAAHSAATPLLVIVAHPRLLHKVKGVLLRHYDALAASDNLACFLWCFALLSATFSFLFFLFLPLPKGLGRHFVDFLPQSTIAVVVIDDVILISVSISRGLIVARLDVEDHAAPLIDDPLGQVLHLRHVRTVLRVDLHCAHKLLTVLQRVSLDVQSIDHVKDL